VVQVVAGFRTPGLPVTTVWLRLCGQRVSTARNVKLRLPVCALEPCHICVLPAGLPSVVNLRVSPTALHCLHPAFVRHLRCGNPDFTTAYNVTDPDTGLVLLANVSYVVPDEESEAACSGPMAAGACVEWYG
jgi:hypothetical protein